MPEFPLLIVDPDTREQQESIVMTLNRAPKRGSDFRLPDGTTARVLEIRIISGDKVIIARRQ
jgi:hypothetical protein